MMHNRKNIKLYDAEQAKRVYQYKNTKIKLYKNSLEFPLGFVVYASFLNSIFNVYYFRISFMLNCKRIFCGIMCI